MALNEGAKVSNLKRAIDLYCYTNFKNSEGLNVDFEGLPFDDTAVQSWVQPRIVDISESRFFPSGASGQYAEDCNILFQVNIFEKKSGSTNTLRHYEMRDSIANYLKIGQDITVYESSGTTAYGSLRVRNVANDNRLAETNELNQYVYAVEMQWTRLTNKV